MLPLRISKAAKYQANRHFVRFSKPNSIISCHIFRKILLGTPFAALCSNGYQTDYYNNSHEL
jgi:hypothetical protein